jgi:ATP-dependent helicase/nuclease subunit A
LKDTDATWDDLRSFFQNIPAIPALTHHASETPEKAEWIALFEQYFAETLYYTTGKFGTAKYESQFLLEKGFAFARSQAEITCELRSMQPAIEKFLWILTDLDQAYAEVKRKANMVDFDDFEHLALRILKTDTVRQYYRDKFHEIYVDEYQDTSSIQEAILKEIVCENCFMVGDVKQSIYRFRHAKPRIFIEKKESLRNHSCAGTVFELNQNFRSVSGILRAVNDVFYQIMSEKAGEIDYNDRDDTQALVPHRQDIDQAPHPAEILLVDISGAEPTNPGDSQELEEAREETTNAEGYSGAADAERKDTDDKVLEEDGTGSESLDEPVLSKEESSGYQKEALAVAIRIKELLSEKVEDERADENGERQKFMRQTRPADIAVLARTRGICGIFAETLESFGLPVQQERTETFLDRYELKVIEALLIILDNPMQDIPLVSVMRAPLFENGFCEEDLLCIRIEYADKAYFYECCEAYATNGPDTLLREKLKSFYQWLNRLRDGLTSKSVSELIEEVYIETEFLAVAARMPDGLSRVTALQEFQDWARGYDQSRQAGLYSFLRYMEAFHEKSPGQSPFGVEQSQADSIKVMTMHKSKGLEYKVVFLVGNNRRLASKDTRDPILVSEEFGIGFQFVDVKRQFRYPTPLILSMKENMHKAEMAEEMRLLYVGMTRAMDRLFITGTCSSEDNRNDKGLALRMAKARGYASCEPLPPQMALSAKSTLEWVMMAVARNPSIDFTLLGIPSLEKTPARDEELRFFNDSWSLAVTKYTDVQKKAQAMRQQKEESPDIAVRPGTPDTGASRQESCEFWQEDGASGQEIGLSDPDGRMLEETFDCYNKTFLQEYPYGDAARSPLKVSVSEIKRREQDNVWDREEGKVTDQLTLPSFIPPLRGINVTRRELEQGNKALMARSDIGIAVHSFLRYMNLESLMADPSRKAITDHIDHMAGLGMINKEESIQIKTYTTAFERYLQSDLAKRILAAGKQTPSVLFREIPFTIRMNCKTLLGGNGFAEDDATFVQGMIDCWFVEGGEAVLVDYKTDRIEGDEEQLRQTLRERYRTQLSIYALAIQKTTGLRVKQSILWLVDKAKAYDVEPDETLR